PSAAQDHRQCGGIYSWLEARERSDRLQFGREEKRAPIKRNIERLFSEAVAHQVQDAGSAVPDRKSKHSGKPSQGQLDAEVFERGEHHLGVAVAAEPMAVPLEFSPKFGKVVDLAVESHHQAFAVRQHGLMTRLREVDDRESAMTESNADIEVAP